MKKWLCKILGHKWKYNFKYMPSKRECKRCGTIHKLDIILTHSDPFAPWAWVDDRLGKYHFEK